LAGALQSFLGRRLPLGRRGRTDIEFFVVAIDAN
jgi:hypothetical protein